MPNLREVPPQERGLVCSFCGKNRRQVKKLIVTQSGIGICDQCVELCEDILKEDHIK